MDDGASTHMAVKDLHEETILHGLLHEIVAKELQTTIVEYLAKWAAKHKGHLLENIQAGQLDLLVI